MADRKKAARKARSTRRAGRVGVDAAACAAMTDTNYIPNGLLGKLMALATQLETLRMLTQRSGRLAFPLIGQVSYLFPAEPAAARVNAALGRNAHVPEDSGRGSDAPRRAQVSQACSELLSEAEALIGYLQTFNEGLEAALPPEDGSVSKDEPVKRVFESVLEDTPRGVRGDSAVTRVRPQW
jgi:hypothetical protein